MWQAKNGKGEILKSFQDRKSCVDFCTNYNNSEEVGGFPISYYENPISIVFYCKKNNVDYQSGKYEKDKIKAANKKAVPELVCSEEVYKSICRNLVASNI